MNDLIKKRISETCKIKGVGKWMKGKKHSEKTKKKMSLSHKGKRPYKMTSLVRKNMSLGQTGRKHSVEHRTKINLKISGDKNYHWKGGYENTLMLNRKRRINKLGNGGSHTLVDWQTLKAQYNWTCLCCHRKEPEIKLTEDHIIPLSKGGSDNIENIQPLCRSCNCKKYNQEKSFE